MDRATLLRMLEDNRDLFEQTLAKVHEPLLTQPPDESGLAVRDIVAHLTVWEGRLIGWLEAAVRGESTPIPEAGATWDDMDRLNAVTYASNRDRPLDAVLQDKRRSFARLVQLVAGFSDDELTDRERFPWLDVQPLWRRIARGPGIGHYQAHLYDLWLRIEPAQRYVAEPALLKRLAGTYAAGDERRTFAVEGDHLLMLGGADGRLRKACVALDPVHFAYEAGGTITFDEGEDGRARGMKVWTYHFQRVLDEADTERTKGAGA